MTSFVSQTLDVNKNRTVNLGKIHSFLRHTCVKFQAQAENPANEIKENAL